MLDILQACCDMYEEGLVAGFCVWIGGRDSEYSDRG